MMSVVPLPYARDDNLPRGNIQTTQHGRKPVRSERDVADVVRFRVIRGPLWSDLFYVAVAFGTASAIMWQIGY